MKQPQLANVGRSGKADLKTFWWQIISQITRESKLLLHHAGERVYDIFETLEDTGESNDYNAAIEKLTEYFSPQKNTEHQILMFRKRYQRQSETPDQFQNPFANVGKRL